MGNIAGDSINRDIVINHGGLQALLKAVDPSDAGFYGTMAISYLCRVRPLPSLEKTRSAIPFFCKIIVSQTDPDILIHAIWALSHLSRSLDTLDDVMNYPEVIPVVISLLS